MIDLPKLAIVFTFLIFIIGGIYSSDIKVLEKPSEYLRRGTQTVRFLTQWPNGTAIRFCGVNIPSVGDVEFLKNGISSKPEFIYYDGNTSKGFEWGYCGVIIPQIKTNYTGKFLFQLAGVEHHHERMKSKTIEFQIKYGRPPDSVNLELKQSKDEKEFYLTCTAEGSKPSSRFRWMANNDNVTHGHHNWTTFEFYGKWTTTTVLRLPFRDDDVGKIYRCFAEHPSFYESKNASVFIPGKPTNSEEQLLALLEDGKLRATKTFAAYPEPSITWTLNGEVLQNSDVNEIRLEPIGFNKYEASLTIKDLDNVEKFEILILTASNERGSASYSFGIIKPSGLLVSLVGIIVIGALMISGMAIMLTVLHVHRRRKHRQNVDVRNSPPER